MEKAKFKKNIHFTNEEEIFVAKMISDGADYNKGVNFHTQLFQAHKNQIFLMNLEALGLFSIPIMLVCSLVRKFIKRL